MILKQNEFWKLYTYFHYTNANSATKVFMLDGSNKTHPTNVPGRASTTLPGLALKDVF